MRSLEEITYDAGRHALADQEALVAGIRQRAGTLLAAHALVVSFLGASALRDAVMSPLTWLALVTLVAGLVIASVLLAPWRIRFSHDATDSTPSARRPNPKRSGSGRECSGAGAPARSAGSLPRCACSAATQRTRPHEHAMPPQRPRARSFVRPPRAVSNPRSPG